MAWIDLGRLDGESCARLPVEALQEWPEGFLLEVWSGTLRVPDRSGL